MDQEFAWLEQLAFIRANIIHTVYKKIIARLSSNWYTQSPKLWVILGKGTCPR
jgi:hypothetical protein